MIICGISMQTWWNFFIFANGFVHKLRFVRVFVNFSLNRSIYWWASFAVMSFYNRNTKFTSSPLLVNINVLKWSQNLMLAHLDSCPIANQYISPTKGLKVCCYVYNILLLYCFVSHHSFTLSIDPHRVAKREIKAVMKTEDGMYLKAEPRIPFVPNRKL